MRGGGGVERPSLTNAFKNTTEDLGESQPSNLEDCKQMHLPTMQHKIKQN